MSQQQIETLTVLGTVTQSGNATVVVTSARMPNSPKTFNVAVTAGDSAAQVALNVILDLTFDADVTSTFLVGAPSVADIVLTEHLARANDATLNISITNGTCLGLTPVWTSTNTQSGSGLSNGYCTLANLKATDRLNITDTNSDALLEDVIEAVSRWIDAETGRFFFPVALSARCYTAADTSVVFTDDFYTLTGLTIETDTNNDGTFATLWISGDYTALPYNPRSGWPYEAIEITTYGDNSFSRARRGVKVTASWGWAAVPKQIEEVCLLQCERVFKRFATPLGSSGMSALGETRLQIPKADGDVYSLLEPFCRIEK